MTTITFDKVSWQRDRDGVWLCLHAEVPSQVQGICEKFAEDKRYVAELKEYREKRSLTANAYFWQLLDKMAAALMRDKEDLYLDYVKHIGPFKDFTLTEEEAKTFRVAWSMLGTGWPTEQVDISEDGDKLVIRAYYGSSQYSTRQMSRLIDTVVEDAKGLGIETLTPLELARLKEEWRGGA